MALQDKVRARTAPFLEPGEEVRQAILVEAGAPPWLFFGVILGLGAFVVLWLMKPLIIAVTDRGVVILRAGRFRPSSPKEVVARLPRQTRLGPANGRLWARLNIAGQRVWVHRRFFPQVREADAPLLVPPSTAPAGAEEASAWSSRPGAGMPLPGVPGTAFAAPARPVGTWPLEAGRARTWQWVLAGVAGLATALAVVGTVAGSSESAARDRLKAYVAGTERHSFVAADGRFRAVFPGLPRRQVQGENISGGNLQTVVYQREVGLDTTFLVSYVDVPSVPPDVTGALNGAANAVAVGLKGEILDSKETTLVGRPAIEFVVNSTIEGGTKKVHYGKVTLLLDGRRLYTIGVLGPKNPPDGYASFIASFSILP